MCYGAQQVLYLIQFQKGREIYFKTIVIKLLSLCNYDYNIIQYYLKLQ